jgi:hypothetical protein
MPGDVSKAPREWKPTLLAKNCSNAFVVSPCVSMWIQIALLSVVWEIGRRACRPGGEQLGRFAA